MLEPRRDELGVRIDLHALGTLPVGLELVARRTRGWTEQGGGATTTQPAAGFKRGLVADG